MWVRKEDEMVSVWGLNMLKAFLKAMISDESGGEVLEYALIAGLIVAGAITVIGSVGSKVAADWSSLNSSM
jgi:Flp pilus assembly pilin Flp